jgi:hypothetical protein
VDRVQARDLVGEGRHDDVAQKYVATQEMAKEVLLQMFYEVENRQARDSDLKVSGPNMFGYFGRKMTYKAVFNSDRGKWELSLKWALEPVSGVGRYNKIRDAIKHYAEYIRDISEECEELN